jgi:predicted nucleic acid-binding Zn ribbon protein
MIYAEYARDPVANRNFDSAHERCLDAGRDYSACMERQYHRLQQNHHQNRHGMLPYVGILALCAILLILQLVSAADGAESLVSNK